MASKQISKVLLKKLSALRATLSDEEQLLLDNLLLVHGETPNGESSTPEPVVIKRGRDNARIRIKFDQECEAYMLE